MKNVLKTGISHLQQRIAENFQLLKILYNPCCFLTFCFTLSLSLLVVTFSWFISGILPILISAVQSILHVCSKYVQLIQRMRLTEN